MKNISVANKLIFGIGAILLLTVILAVNSFSSINNINVRAYNTERIALLGEHTDHLYIDSLNYKISSDEQYIANIRSVIEQIKHEAAETKTTLIAQRNIDAMDQLLLDMSEYERLFSNYIKANKNKENNLAAAVSSGAATNTALAELNLSVNGTTHQPFVHEDLYSATTGRLVTELVISRRALAYLARVYLMEETDSSLEKLEQGYNELKSIAATLQQRLPSNSSDAVSQILEDIDVYMNYLRDMSPLTVELIVAEKQMNDVYARVQADIDALNEFVRELRAQETNQSKVYAAILTVLAIGLGVLIGWYIIKQIVTPLSQAVTIAQAIGDGDMTGHGVEKRGDEFGVLLNALDQTRDNLREALGEVNGFTSQLAAAAEELSAVTTQTSAGVQSQREETDQVATAMNEMTATVQEVARSAEEAASAVEKANRLVLNGEQVLQSVLDSNNRLTVQIKQSSEAMHRLNEDSTNISTVLTVINSIAEQTNLLALNAAIEAARAGEAGRGFAVVADEVRGLAHRTQVSIAQIEELIANLQTGSGNAVVMMDSSCTLSTATLELVEEANHELQAITRVVHEIQAMGMQIATAAEEQSLVAEEINRNIVNVNNVADQSAAAVEETAASSHELARLGQQLQNLVMRFKI